MAYSLFCHIVLIPDYLLLVWRAPWYLLGCVLGTLFLFPAISIRMGWRFVRNYMNEMYGV